jgi:regulator of RNase E activity RraA
MIQTPDIVRPNKKLVAALQEIGSATASAELSRMGIRDAHIRGPVTFTPGACYAGPALTLQMMPKREDQYKQAEYADPETQLHRHVLYHTQPGDFVCVDARGDLGSGIFGEMMLTFFKGRGGKGVVIDGCIRDYPHAKNLGLGLWLKGTTPNYHTQTNLFPYAVNVPIALCNCLVMPGDIIVADDDGATVVPAQLAAELVDHASDHAEWEEFSRLRLSQGGDLRKYYPLRADAQDEYQAWKKKQSKAKSNRKKK